MKHNLDTWQKKTIVLSIWYILGMLASMPV